jgi:altered-inheritance-of-mitochondria protein 13
VAAELEKIKNHESETLESLRKKIAADAESHSSDSSTSSSDSILSIPSISPKDLLPSADSEKKSATSQKVQQEIEKLKQTLGQRKVLKELPKDVESAYVRPLNSTLAVLTRHRRQDVISCLRLNDRKPLDCWKEVEVFKREVRKMEENYVSSVL